MLLGTQTARRTVSAIRRWHDRWIDRRFTASGLRSIRNHSFYAPLIGRDATVVDLGANTGTFSSSIADEYGCTCYAVEASAALYRALPASPRLLKFNYLIGERNEPAEFYLSANSEASSTDPRFANTWGLDGRALVGGITLETFLKRNNIRDVDLLKCDIEGSEMELFASMSDETARQVKQFSVEFHDFLDASRSGDVINIRARLSALGFFSITSTVPYSNEDVLFINKGTCAISTTAWLKLYILKHVVLRSRSTRERILRALVKPAQVIGATDVRHED